MESHRTAWDWVLEVATVLTAVAAAAAALYAASAARSAKKSAEAAEKSAAAADDSTQATKDLVEIEQERRSEETQERNRSRFSGRVQAVGDAFRVVIRCEGPGNAFNVTVAIYEPDSLTPYSAMAAGVASVSQPIAILLAGTEVSFMTATHSHYLSVRVQVTWSDSDGDQVSDFMMDALRGSGFRP